MLLSWNTSASITSHGLSGMSWCMVFSLGCVCWNARHMLQLFTWFSMSLLILTQYTDSCTSSLVVFFDAHVINMELVQFLLLQTFRDNYAPTLHDYTFYDCQVIFVGPVWSYVNVKLMICVWPTCNYNIFWHWRCSSCALVCWICDKDIHSQMFVMLCTVSTLLSMSWIGSSLYSLWVWIDSQSAINISGQGLYRMWTLYW